MNLILFNSKEDASWIPACDPRAKHILEVLKRGVGESFFVGVVNGLRGSARILESDTKGIRLDVRWEVQQTALFPVSLLVGLPRPQTARRLLFEATTLGVSQLAFYISEKSEPSYAQSSLWTTDEWRQRLILGAEQAFCPQIPEVLHFEKLKTALERVASQTKVRLALDNYEATVALGAVALEAPVQLVLGGERGFSARERDVLLQQGYTLCHLGERVLRTETAATAALAICLSRLALLG